MAKQETTIDFQKSEINALTKALSETASLLDSVKLGQAKTDEKFAEMQKNISECNNSVT